MPRTQRLKPPATTSTPYIPTAAAARGAGMTSKASPAPATGPTRDPVDPATITGWTFIDGKAYPVIGSPKTPPPATDKKTELAQKLAAANTELQRMLTRYAEKHPHLIAQRALVADLEKQLSLLPP